ncbi:phosphotransferase [Paenibacillus marchantiophytorum]|uniref:Phosphocarrier protein HPr n=1 Tax=Paenibacillus marchantiophytorum TaxID=1619310 RepID=A0ABQ1EMU1_9BACL|nr:HPr family phosphocarrier protein [Paenibacillus marchantiophytorum]GFZ78910.1 phosphotransferase [Paenibacillus marchantiophytorum]
MHELIVTLNHPLGMHARPIAVWVSLAKTFASDISVTTGGLTADGKSALQLLTLAAKYKDELHIRTSGPDEIEALATLVALIRNHFPQNE